MSGQAVAILALSAAAVLGGTAHRRTEQGNRAYGEERFDEALRSYTDAQVESPEAAALHYNIGNVLYRQGDFDGAAEAYTRALLGASPELESRASYNLGNARFRKSEFDAAAEAYRRALRAAPADREAKRNLELALRALAQQQQQQQQPQSGQDPDEGQGQTPPPQAGGSEAPSGEPQPPGSTPAGEQPPEGMTPEQAGRLLDSLNDQERRQLEQELRKAKGAGDARREKDW